jgi:thioredoxin reductase (NADPH)
MRAGIETVLLERMLPGGTPTNTERIENYPGFPEGISGKELMDRFVAHAKATGLLIKEFSMVEGIEKTDKRFLVKATDNLYEAEGVIIATGTEPARLGIPGEERFTGRGVSYCATCDGAFFKGLDVAVIGGGDAAIEEGLSLANLVRKVYIIHRREGLRAQKVLQDRAFKNDKIEFLLNKRPIEISGKDEVESIVIEDVRDGKISSLKVKGIFVYVGSRPDTAFLGTLVDRDEEGFLLTDENLLTKTIGLYIAGDVRKKLLRQISTAVGDGAIAAVNLERYLLERG